MIIFGHRLLFDYRKNNVENLDLYPQLFINEYKSKSKKLSNVTTFEQNQGRVVHLSTDGLFEKRSTNQVWCFRVEEVVEFRWISSQSLISYTIFEKGSKELLEYWLLHTLLYIYLSIEQKYEFIHAGGVIVEDKSILFVGESFGGKSTLTDYFMKKNHTMISDDRIGVRDKDDMIELVSSYPYHRPYRQEEDLGLKVDNFLQGHKKLDIIYELHRVAYDSEILFEEIKGIEKYKVLQYSFDFNIPLNKIKSFKLMGEMASLIPVFKVSIPWDLERLDEVYLAICHHSKKESLNVY